MLRDSQSILTSSEPPRTTVAVAVGMNRPPDPARIVIRVATAAISDEDTERFERIIAKHPRARRDDEIPDTAPARPAPNSTVRARLGIADEG